MTEFKEKLKRLQLPSWMNQGEPDTLLRATKRFWQRIYEGVTWPLTQLDPETCAEPLLNLLAYQKDIQRFNGEPLNLHRKRVKYAFINAKDAGSIAGFVDIFQHLGVGYVEINERQPEIDWDEVVLRVSDGQIVNHPDLLLNIIRQYDRTCRRYRFEVMVVHKLRMPVGFVEADYVYSHATLTHQPLWIRIGQISASSQTFGASLI